METKKMQVRDIEAYWERLSEHLSFYHNFLQRKSEYGSCASEAGVQWIVLSTAESIAREHGLHVNMVSCLCQAVSFCFPKRGYAELCVIKDLIRKNGWDIPLSTLEIDAIEYFIDHRVGSTVTPELDALLKAYYSEDESVPEVNLVRFLQKYLRLHRAALQEGSILQAGQVTGEIMEQARKAYETDYRLLPDPPAPALPPEVLAKIEEYVNVFVDYYKDAYKGVYRVVV